MFLDVGALAFGVISIAGFLLYFVPTFIAFRQGSDNRWWVLLVNVLLGATLLGWVVALHLATREQHPRQRSA